MFRVFGSIAIVGLLTIATFGSLQGSPSQPAAEQKSPQATAGAQTFTKNCMQCHAVYEGQESFGPNLFHEMKPPHPKKTPAEIREILKSGKGKMPSFNAKLSSGDMDNLIAYLHTL
jgi:mono/diheme cytochrome c family protein